MIDGLAKVYNTARWKALRSKGIGHWRLICGVAACPGEIGTVSPEHMSFLASLPDFTLLQQRFQFPIEQTPSGFAAYAPRTIVRHEPYDFEFLRSELRFRVVKGNLRSEKTKRPLGRRPMPENRVINYRTLGGGQRENFEPSVEERALVADGGRGINGICAPVPCIIYCPACNRPNQVDIPASLHFEERAVGKGRESIVGVVAGFLAGWVRCGRVGYRVWASG